MKCLDLGVVILEGDPSWTLDGTLMGKGYGSQFTRQQYRGVQWSIQQRGFWVVHTENLRDTVETVQWLETYLRKPTHASLTRRPGPVSPWGKTTNRDYVEHLVQGIPGVGPEMSKRIVDSFGLPFAWKEEVTVESLMRIQGIGKKKAEQIIGGLT